MYRLPSRYPCAETPLAARSSAGVLPVEQAPELCDDAAVPDSDRCDPAERTGGGRAAMISFK